MSNSDPSAQSVLKSAQDAAAVYDDLIEYYVESPTIDGLYKCRAGPGRIIQKVIWGRAALSPTLWILRGSVRKIIAG